MSNKLDFRRNYADQTALAMHLKCCNNFYVPRLSNRVNIEDYTKKIHCQAERFEAWCKQELIGLVAVYCNKKKNRTAFITNVSVVSEWQGQKIAVQLLDHCFDHLRFNRFDYLELEVDELNQPAFSLYLKLGFKSTFKNKSTVTMLMTLSSNSK